MDRLISLQAAIDAVRTCSVKEVTPAYMLIDKAEVMKELMLLPSAQPEPCEDAVSRRDAIDAIGEVHPLDYNAQAIKSRIEKLPPVQPKNCEVPGQWFCESDGEMMYDQIAWRERPEPYREEGEQDG